MISEKWFFDPSCPAAVPEDISACLRQKGIPQEQVLICVRSDLNRDSIRCDSYLLATDTFLISLSGSSVLTPAPKSLFSGLRMPDRHFELLTWDVYELIDLFDFKLDELVSSARLTCTRSDGSGLVLANLSGTYKSDFTAVRDMLAGLKKNGTVTPDKKRARKNLFCPKCGARYPDEKRPVCPRCMDKRRIIARTGEFVLKYKVKLLLSILMLLLTGALSIITPYVSSGFYYDRVLDRAGEFYGQLLLVLGIIVGTRLLAVLVNIVHNVVSSIIAADVVFDLKKVIFSSIERLSLSFFTGRQSGGLMTQVTRDANTIHWFFCDGVPFFLVNAVQIIAMLVIMFLMSPVLTLICLVTVPFILLFSGSFIQKMNRFHSRRWTHARKMNAVLSDILTGIRVVKAFSKEKAETKRFGSASVSLAEAEYTASVFSATAFPAVSLLIYISNILVIAAGGYMVMRGEMTYGILLTFEAYMNMVLNPMSEFIQKIYDFTDSMNAMNRLIEIMDTPPDVVESPSPVRPQNCTGRVEFRHVGFSYENSRKVIDDVSFTVEPGHALGIVGHTGAGKTTLVNLLIRLYDAQEGEILIDGVNIRDLSFDYLRRNVAVVSQETYLFSGSILDNIRYARPEASIEEVIRASKLAGAHDFIIQMPDAYSTMIGLGHKELSGGERQRLSIARALLRDPKILILDEATAAMDTQTERRIQTALEQLSGGRTTLTIAHRLSTLRGADKLIVIEKGRVVEEGSHFDLINQKGAYYNLYRLQMAAMKNLGIEN